MTPGTRRPKGSRPPPSQPCSGPAQSAAGRFILVSSSQAQSPSATNASYAAATPVSQSFTVYPSMTGSLGEAARRLHAAHSIS